MQVGVINIGTVDEVGGASIQTQFLVIGIPIAPLSSFYCLPDGKALDIPLNGKSILLGYLRTWSALGALLCTMAAFMVNLGLLAPAVGLIGLWAASMFKLGKLDPDEQLRRELLRSHTGMGIDPRHLHVFDAHKIYKSLREEWCEQTGLQGWRGSIKKARGAEASLLYVLATYKAASEPGNREAKLIAQQAWQRVGAEASSDALGFALGVAIANVDREEAEAQSRTERDTQAERREERSERRERSERPERSERRREDRIERPQAKRRTPRAKILRESSRGLEIQCPSCAKAMKVSYAMAGKKGRCSRCKGKLRIPSLERRMAA